MTLKEKIDLILNLKEEIRTEPGLEHCVVLNDGKIVVDSVPVGVLGYRVNSDDGAFYAYHWEQDGVKFVHYTRRLSNELV